MTAVPHPDTLLNDAIMIDSSARLYLRERGWPGSARRFKLITACLLPPYTALVSTDIHIRGLSNKNKVVRTSKEFMLGLI